MDSYFYTADVADDDSLFGSSTVRPIQSLSDLDEERLYLVDHRWWNEARESLFKEIGGVLYATSSCLFSDVFESEIILDMRRSEIDSDNWNGEEQGVSGREYALVSEWMFYRALKWHYDMENAGNSVDVEDNKADLFPLQISLSISGITNALVVKINLKGNGLGAFNKSWQIFNTDSGLLKIWDFSGQTTKFFIQVEKSEQINAEILLELQVYGLYYDTMQKESEMAVEEDFITEDFPSSSSSSSSTILKLNGHSEKVNPYVRVDRSPRITNNSSQTLGLTGLCNLGNTCFMNSAIQCLVHTPHLVDYFLGDFRKDLNFENPLGVNGKLALAFGDLLRQIWTPGASAVAPKAFKSRLSGFAPQFSGYNQHDSQEFLAFLLDGLHEDLNRVKIKPYNEIKDVDGISDKQVADEHWRNHLARNDSIIVDMCQGQYRSTLICPECKKHSVTFDPFIYLSLPLPSTSMRTMTLTVVSSDGTCLPVPVTVTVPKYGKKKDLIQALTIACSLSDDETFLLAEVYSNCILHFLDEQGDSLELVRDFDRLVAYRLLKEEDPLPLVVFTHYRDEELYRGGRPVSKPFGIPLVARVPENVNGSDIHKKFLKLLQPFVLPEEFFLEYPENTPELEGDLDTGTEMDVDQKLVVYDDDDDDDDNDESEVKEKEKEEEKEKEKEEEKEEEFEFYLEKPGYYSVGTTVIMDDEEPLVVPKNGRYSVRAIWPDEMLKRYDTSILSNLVQTGGMFGSRTKTPPESVALYKCLEAFLKEEPLGPEDMWYCPTCKEHRQASKKLDLWRLPEIVIIHLKRFSYNRFSKDKLETFVDFPIDDFDVSSYTVEKDNQSCFRYKLYAVSNHYGGMGGGHYTAFAQCGEEWYEFNDSQVYPVSEEQIKTSAAYVLFYRRV